MNYKIFCDESCHLQNYGWDSMTLGALKCPSDPEELDKMLERNNKNDN